MKILEEHYSAACTLFEGHYHYGVAALINSLYTNGYRGNFYTGYRGTLPAWANTAYENAELNWVGSTTLNIKPDLNVHFLPVTIDYDLTNYKPAFLLALKNYNSKGFFYFDPDIVIKCKWEFFERWIKYGVAVVQEIVGNRLSPLHPKRMQWAEFIHRIGKDVKRPLSNYFNGGFCGVSKDNLEFLYIWKDIIEKGIELNIIDANYFYKQLDQTSAFPVGDQDALNAATMCCTSPVSDFGPEGMDFIPGGWLMSHANIRPKPWQVNFLRKALSGKKISQPEKNYWANTNTVIVTCPDYKISIKKFFIKLGSFLNRFYLKS